MEFSSFYSDWFQAVLKTKRVKKDDRMIESNTSRFRNRYICLLKNVLLLNKPSLLGEQETSKSKV